MVFIAGLDIAWFPFGGWELDQRNRFLKLHIFGVFVILDRMQLQITCTYKEENVFFVPAVVFGHNWNGISRTWRYGELFFI